MYLVPYLASDGEGVDGDLVVSRICLFHARHEPTARKSLGSARGYVITIGVIFHTTQGHDLRTSSSDLDHLQRKVRTEEYARLSGACSLAKSFLGYFSK